MQIFFAKKIKKLKTDGCDTKKPSTLPEHFLMAQKNSQHTVNFST